MISLFVLKKIRKKDKEKSFGNETIKRKCDRCTKIFDLSTIIRKYVSNPNTTVCDSCKAKCLIDVNDVRKTSPKNGGE